MIEIVVGALLAIAMILITYKNQRTQWVYSIGLISLPFIYVIFALIAGDGNAIGKEMFYGAPFIVVGALCLNKKFKGATLLLATFWLVHGAYDIYHDVLFVNAGTPGWYPVFCAAFDLVVGGYLLIRFKKLNA